MDVNGSFTMESVNAANIWSLADTFLMVYASLLLIIGIPGNIICGIIMGGNKANRLTTRILMVILSIADTGVLLTAVLRYWSIKIFDWDLRNDGPISCKLHVFSVAFSTDFAVGSLCAIAVERLLVVAFPHRANNVVTVTSVVLGMTSFGVLIAVKNLIHFWMMGMHSTAPTGENQTTIDIPGVEEENTYPLRCLSGPSYRTLFRLFMKIDFVSFAVLPYVILFSSNVYIYLKLRKQQAILKQTKQRSQNLSTTAGRPSTLTHTLIERSMISRMDGITGVSSAQPVPKRVKRRPESAIKLLTALTLIHVGCTLPGTIFTFLTFYFTDYFQHMNRDTHELIKVSLVMLVFTNNAINFFGYYASCISFRESLRNMFLSLCRCKRRPGMAQSRGTSSVTWFARCCACPSSHSNLPDRVHIVAPKPCAPTNGESANNFPQINVTTVPHDEGI